FKPSVGVEGAAQNRDEAAEIDRLGLAQLRLRDQAPRVAATQIESLHDDRAQSRALALVEGAVGVGHVHENGRRRHAIVVLLERALALAAQKLRHETANSFKHPNSFKAPAKIPPSRRPARSGSNPAFILIWVHADKPPGAPRAAATGE